MAYTWKPGERDDVMQEAMGLIVELRLRKSDRSKFPAKALPLTIGDLNNCIIASLAKHGLVTTDQRTKLTPRQQTNLRNDIQEAMPRVWNDPTIRQLFIDARYAALDKEQPR